MKWIYASDITNWANTDPRCKDIFPELIRRLILAHAKNNIDLFDFPGGKSITIGGWDGRLNTSFKSPFFPLGISGWEIGTEKAARAKAEKDYVKRTSDPLGIVCKESTFVFVTPRSFRKYSEWEADKKKAKIWKDIRVITADSLEQWLDLTPAVAMWLARQLHKSLPPHIRDIEYFWQEWSICTKPVMTSDLVIAGRNKDVELMQKWLMGTPSIMQILGDHTDEALAFLYSAIDKLPDQNRLQALARCVVVDNLSQFREITQLFEDNPLIIAAPSECIDAAHLATSKGHHVFISVDTALVGYRDVVRLSRPQQETIENILHSQGLSKSVAQMISRDSGRSIQVLRRNLFQSLTKAPKWATAKDAISLLPVLFANSWDDHKKEDRKIIELLSGKSYDEFEKGLNAYLSLEDAPVRKVGSIWMIKSPHDAWFILGQYLTDKQLNLFKESLISVLTKTDPKYDLQADQRWAAALYGKENPYSNWLRSGIVESLALIAVYSNRAPKTISTQAFSNKVVTEVFSKVNKWELWASLKDATTMLSEASPDSFISVVEKTLKDDSEIFINLMKDDPEVFGECRHSGLLWGLEGLAWSKIYFSSAVKILAMLANIDPGGRWGNRPLTSLKNIFLPGYPQTYATPEQRITTLDSIISMHPRRIFEFIQTYLEPGGFTESHRFRWRDAGGSRRGYDPEEKVEYEKYMQELWPRISNLALKEDNLAASIKNFIRFPNKVKSNLLEKLEKFECQNFTEEYCANIYESIRELLNWINSYGNEENQIYVPALKKILEKIMPINPIERCGWLLETPWPRLPEGSPKQYELKDEAVKKAQVDAARKILDGAKMDEIIKFAKKIHYPGLLGRFLGKAIASEKEDTEILNDLLPCINDLPLLIIGYAQGRIENLSDTWVSDQIQRLKSENKYTPRVCALLHLGLPENASTWAAVAQQGIDVEREYWKFATGFSQTNFSEDSKVAIEKLLDVKRPETALQIAGDSKSSIPSNLLKKMLQELINSSVNKIGQDPMTSYYLSNVFNQLYEKKELALDEIAMLEWPFAAFFDDFKRELTCPLAIHKVLQKDPNFFALLITFLYKKDDYKASEDSPQTEKAEIQGKIAFKVLNSWNLIPGQKNDNSLDEMELKTWIEQAREKCFKNGYSVGGDIEIGFMLAHAPIGTDGIWPHVAVRNLIELLNNEIIDKHIQTEIINSRGVVSRDLFEGGKQERALAENYRTMSDKIVEKWPRTARILRSLAEEYENQAKYEDTESDLDNLRLF